MGATFLDETPPPLAIGGVGGSGTRLIAELAHGLGFHMGTDLNSANDTLWYTLLFKRAEILDASKATMGHLASALEAALRGGRCLPDSTISMISELSRSARPPRPIEWLQARTATLLEATRSERRPGDWGWKEPNTHMCIETFLTHWPTLRYVHVVRHGLDMAYSRNQNQLHLWGPQVLGDDAPPTPARSLAFWCRVHRRIQELQTRHPDRVYWLDYDAFCRDPHGEAGKLCAFLGREPAGMDPVIAKVRQPGVPRHSSGTLDAFDPRDVEYVASLGYPILPARH